MFANREEIMKLASAGRPSQELFLPAGTTGTLSQKQAEAIVKAAARRLLNKTLTTQSTFTGLNKGASKQITGELMNVERLGLVREILPRETAALGNLVQFVRKWTTFARYESR